MWFYCFWSACTFAAGFYSFFLFVCFWSTYKGNDVCVVAFWLRRCLSFTPFGVPSVLAFVHWVFCTHTKQTLHTHSASPLLGRCGKCVVNTSILLFSPPVCCMTSWRDHMSSSAASLLLLHGITHECCSTHSSAQKVA